MAYAIAELCSRGMACASGEAGPVACAALSAWLGPPRRRFSIAGPARERRRSRAHGPRCGLSLSAVVRSRVLRCVGPGDTMLALVDGGASRLGRGDGIATR